jgi:large subunit ribosomal protein L4
MEAITLPIYNTEGKEIDTVNLDTDIFKGVVNKDVLYQAIVAYRARKRSGLASTKTRGEVRGGGRKPWRQKGTGRARVGSTRSPLWRHGGVIFGPHPRDFSYPVPRKILVVSLISALSAKIKEKNLIVLDSLDMQTKKTKDAAKVFSNLKASPQKKRDGRSVLLLLGKPDALLKLAVRNINFLNFNLAKDTNTYEVMAAQKIVITKEGLESLTARIKKSLKG